MRESLHLSTQIARPAELVYAFLDDPANLPQWAAGLSGAIEQRDGRWFADSPMGDVEVRFVEQNAYGVLDHDVTLPDGTTVTNPMRVIADEDGCEVLFTVRRAPGDSAAELQADAAAVRADLATLKQLLE